jgi:hypothetical protein
MVTRLCHRYRSHEREIPKILGRSSSHYNYYQLSPSFIQEEVYEEEQRVTSVLEEMFNLYNTQLHANQTNQSSSSNPRNIRY